MINRMSRQKNPLQILAKQIYLLIGKGRTKEAKQMLQALYPEETNHPIFAIMLAGIYAGDHQVSEALKVIERALKEDPTHLLCRLHQLEYQYLCGEWAEAYRNHLEIEEILERATAGEEKERGERYLQSLEGLLSMGAAEKRGEGATRRG